MTTITVTAWLIRNSLASLPKMTWTWRLSFRYYQNDRIEWQQFEKKIDVIHLGRTVCLAGTDSRPRFGRLFLGLHLDANSWRSSGRNLFGQMGHFRVRPHQRHLYNPDSVGRQLELHRRPGCPLHRRTWSRMHNLEHVPTVAQHALCKVTFERLSRAFHCRPFTSCWPNGLLPRNGTSSPLWLTLVNAHHCLG